MRYTQRFLTIGSNSRQQHVRDKNGAARFVQREACGQTCCLLRRTFLYCKADWHGQIHTFETAASGVGMTSEIGSPVRKITLRVACGPIIESLESRTLLSVSLSNGLLSISGTDNADKIAIRAISDTQIRVFD